MALAASPPHARPMTMPRPIGRTPSVLCRDLLHDLVPALLRAAAVLVTAVVLWQYFGTLDPDSADIGGLPIGALAGGTVGALVAAFDATRRRPRAAWRLWALVLVVCWLAVIGLAVVNNGLDPFAPVAALLVVGLVAVPVTAGLGIGLAVRGARH